MQKNIKSFIIGVLVIALCIITFLYYEEVKEDKHEFQGFLNHFYSSVNHSLRNIEYLLKKNPHNKALDENLRALEKDLLKTDTILYNGATYDNKIYISRFFLESTYFLGGLEMTGTTEASIPPMGEDGKLDQKEITILRTIKEHLEETKKAMYSKDTKQENPNLSVEGFNQILMNYANKQADELYSEAFAK